jgi:hypothetical protein
MNYFLLFLMLVAISLVFIPTNKKKPTVPNKPAQFRRNIKVPPRVEVHS